MLHERKVTCVPLSPRILILSVPLEGPNFSYHPTVAVHITPYFVYSESLHAAERQHTHNVLHQIDFGRLPSGKSNKFYP